MHLLMLAALLSSTSAIGAPSARQAARVIDPVPQHCPDTVRQVRGQDRIMPNKLGDLPPGDLSLAVVREVNGCPQPTVVRQGYGAGSAPPEGKDRNRR